MQIIEAETPAGVHALTTTRIGGVSRGVYGSLNLAGHVGDAPDAVAMNRRRLVNEFNLPGEPTWMEQVHGTRVVELGGEQPAGTADAALTREPGVVPGILTADCLPVVLSDEKAGSVAVVHAGWRGLAAGIIEATLDAMSIPPANIDAWLGPAIGPAAYEVGPDVRDAFLGTDIGAAEAFTHGRSGKWYCDLYLLARRRLRAVGVGAITGGDRCTYSERDLFYSYRRDGQCGRMATVAWLEVRG